MELWQEMVEAKERVQREAREGGELVDLPCPFCKRPRSQRSTCIRCTLCATNWLQEEMGLPNYLERDPRVARREAALMANPIKPFAGRLGEDANG